MEYLWLLFGTVFFAFLKESVRDTAKECFTNILKTCRGNNSEEEQGEEGQEEDIEAGHHHNHRDTGITREAITAALQAVNGNDPDHHHPREVVIRLEYDHDHHPHPHQAGFNRGESHLTAITVTAHHEETPQPHVQNNNQVQSGGFNRFAEAAHALVKALRITKTKRKDNNKDDNEEAKEQELAPSVVTNPPSQELNEVVHEDNQAVQQTNIPIVHGTHLLENATNTNINVVPTLEIPGDIGGAYIDTLNTPNMFYSS